MIGKNVLITGGTSGLGKVLVEKFIERGAFVTVVGRNQEKLDALLALSPKINVKKFDLKSLEEVQSIEQWLSINDKQFDIVVNNAGFGYFKSFDKHSTTDIKEIFDVNLVHCSMFIHMVIPYMNQGGQMVTVASQAARVTTPYGSVYAASKSGIYALVNALRLEYPELHFLTINPGPIKTEFFEKADETGQYDRLTEKIQLNKEKLAEHIIESIVSKKIELNRPRWMHYGLTLYNLAPRWIEKHIEKPFLSKKI